MLKQISMAFAIIEGIFLFQIEHIPIRIISQEFYLSKYFHKEVLTNMN